MRQRPVPPSEARPDLRITSAIDDVVLWALAKASAERFQQADAFARLFRSAVEGQSASSWATTTPVSTADASGYRPEPPSRPYIPPPSPWDDAVEEQAVNRPGIGRRIGRGFYRLGGRVARRTGWLRRLIWRLTMLVLAANLVLGGAIWVADGPSGLFPLEPSLEAGGRARVVEATYTVRMEPGLGGPFALGVEAGDEMEITGNPTPADDLLWWPVVVTKDGARVEGYIAQDGIAPVAVGIGPRLVDQAEQRLEELRENAEAWLTGA